MTGCASSHTHQQTAGTQTPWLAVAAVENARDARPPASSSRRCAMMQTSVWPIACRLRTANTTLPKYSKLQAGGEPAGATEGTAAQSCPIQREHLQDCVFPLEQPPAVHTEYVSHLDCLPDRMCVHAIFYHQTHTVRRSQVPSMGLAERTAITHPLLCWPPAGGRDRL